MLSYLTICLVLCAGSYGVFWIWKKRVNAELEEGASFEFSRLTKHEPELLQGIERPQFNAIFKRVETPRFPGYALATFITFLLGSPLFLAILAGGDWLLRQALLVPQISDSMIGIVVNEDGSAKMMDGVDLVALQYYLTDLAGFYYFFGLLAFWLVTVWFFMKRYHSRRPGFLRDEIIRAR